MLPQRVIVLFFILTFLPACSGYRVVRTNNPFEQYNIKSISVPMFINHSSLAGVSSPFTSAFLKSLFEINGLDIVNRKSSADALLIGIIESPQYLRETVRPTGFRLANGISPNSIGQRQDFYIPGSSEVQLQVRVMIIKKPTAEEIALLTSEKGKYVAPQQKLIFNETFQARASYSRLIFDGEERVINSTQNKGLLRENVDKMAQTTANNFRDMVIYAF